MKHSHLPLAVVLGLLAVVGLETASLAGPNKDSRAGTRAPVGPAGEVVKKIDKILAKAWTEAEIKPRKAANDAELLRRLSLDLTGVIPTEKFAHNYLRSSKPSKRADATRKLLASPQFGRSQGLRWAYLLVGRDYLIKSKTMSRAAKARKRMMDRMGDDDGGMMGGGEGYSLDEWLAQQLGTNVPWDEVVSSLISADGIVQDNPAGHYMLRFAREGKAAEATGNVFRVFQGLQVQCAQCHDHPYDDTYSQRDFWGLAAFFARTTGRRAPPNAMQIERAARKNKQARGPYKVVDRAGGQIRMPAPAGQTGPMVLPKFVTGVVVNPATGFDRRGKLAELITQDENPYFARATVNRVWSHFFGRGIINPIDEIKETPSVPALLELLEQDFRASGYDMRRLIEIIVRTRAYGLTSAGNEDDKEAELALFARAPMRSLSAEQLFYSVLSASGMNEFRGAGNRNLRRNIERQKYQMLRQFVRIFGGDEEEIVDEGTIPQALMLLNGPLTNDAVRPRPGHPVYDRLFAMESVDEQIQTIYLRVLSRTPTRAERNKVRAYLSATKRHPKARAQAYADVFWALMNSSEFNLIH